MSTTNSRPDSGLPNLDPNWVRRRKVYREKSPITAFAVVLLIALAGTWVLRTQMELARAERNAKAVSQSVPALAKQRLFAEREAETIAARWPASPSTVQRSRAYWGGSALPAATYWARQRRIDEQARMRARADAMLAREQRRYEQLTGTGAGNWQPSIPTVRYSRCESAKADRERAYQMAGNDRNYDFIRRWNDYVFEACKQG